ncbi:MAG: hypothetical protein JJE21_05500, partial [Spirochaetaceae bacterium]|nr:hypothetical protein [Spirochaetaceae bacterium]
MEIQKITLIVDNFQFIKAPMMEIIEQRLTINKQARIWFSEYLTGTKYAKSFQNRDEQFSIDKEDMEEIFSLFEAIFIPDFKSIVVKDGRNWKLNITYTNDTVVTFSSAIGYELEARNKKLSEYLRE